MDTLFEFTIMNLLWMLKFHFGWKQVSLIDPENNVQSTAGPQIMSFCLMLLCHTVDEMPSEPNSSPIKYNTVYQHI